MPNPLQTLKNKILNAVETIKKNPKILIKIAPILSFIPPLLILYYLYPASYEATWKGRTYYLFFIWLILLELILNWEKIQVKIQKIKSKQFIAFTILLVLPTLYVIIANFYGLNIAIVDISPKHYFPDPRIDPFYWANLMPLSVEYLAFSVLFALIILVTYGIKGLRDFLLPPCLIGIVGLIYVIDNLCPYGYFTPFQILVPTTTILAANVLNMMGYETSITFENHYIYGPVPILKTFDPNLRKYAKTAIAWPCSGVDSLLLYSVTIILFLKNMGISWKRGAIYFIIGAVITYFINILRIVTIVIIMIKDPSQFQRFHEYYGPLYSIIWIITYPLIIMGIQTVLGKIKSRILKKS